MTQNDKLLSEKEVLQLLPLSRATWIRGVKKGTFPTPVYFGKLKFWHIDKINELIEKGTK